MKKIIHYCWFGGKPLPKLAKKCIKSWKKYLPDFEIIEWNENNFDVNVTEFSKQAFEDKKWAFVSDVARVYALKKYGGIYFDTDMLIKKNVDHLLNDQFFAGWESASHVAVGVLAASDKENPVINKLWDFYLNTEFSVDRMGVLTIPIVLTNILKQDYHLKPGHLENQKLEDNIVIYARDYFYPIACDNSSNMFTKNTCMIHYYIGSWISNSDKKRLKFQMLFGEKLGNFILDVLVKIKHLIRNIGKLILFPVVIFKRKKAKKQLYLDQKSSFMSAIEKIKNNDYVAFYNEHWMGTKNATKELFENTVGIGEITSIKLVDDIVEKILEKEIKLVIFSAFSKGWETIIEQLKVKSPKIKIKVVWHGSHAMNVESYDWDRFEKMFELVNCKLIDSIGFVKKSMYDFYKAKGYPVEFIRNTIKIKTDNIVKKKQKTNDDSIKVGLYASGDRWVKNFYNQLGAASLFEKSEIDCIPLNEKTLSMGKIFSANIGGLYHSVSREQLLERMAKNDINFYVTFSECAPLIPLESLELGVPCITGNNHHYWEGTELQKYLVVNENDNCMKIYEQALYCLENKDKILKLYKEWKLENDKNSKESIKKFIQS